MGPREPPPRRMMSLLAGVIVNGSPARTDMAGMWESLEGSHEMLVLGVLRARVEKEVEWRPRWPPFW